MKCFCRKSKYFLIFAAMKQILYIAGFLMAWLFFSPKDELQGGKEGAMPFVETVMEENAHSDMQQQIAVLSKDLKNNNLLTPRRTFQSPTQGTTIRLYDNSSCRVIHYCRLKGENLLAKLQEQAAFRLSADCSTLFCSKAHHVFALRKLLI